MVYEIIDGVVFIGRSIKDHFDKLSGRADYRWMAVDLVRELLRVRSSHTTYMKQPSSEPDFTRTIGGYISLEVTLEDAAISLAKKAHTPIDKIYELATATYNNE